MENRINAESVETFNCNIHNKFGVRRALKVVLRKMLYWWIKPNGDRQNNFNRQVYEQFDELISTLVQQNKRLEIENKELFSKLELESQKFNKLLEDRLIQACFAEEAPMELKVLKAKNDIDVMQETELLNLITSLKENNDTTMPVDLMENIRNVFTDKIKQEVILQEKEDVIVVLCNELKANRKIEAIRKEAYTLYKELYRHSQYDVRLVSIENQENIEFDENISYVPENMLEEFFSKWSIKLLVLIESDLSIVYRARSLFFKYKTLVRVTGQNPLAGVEPVNYEHIRHLNDLGFQRYEVYSQNAQKLLQDIGLKHVDVRYPMMEAQQWEYLQKNISEQLVIGIASSPMEEKQWIDKGMDLLYGVMQAMPEVQFELLWRNEKFQLPKQWLELTNCKVLYGRQDMVQFYSRIDILLLPYATIHNNHACSFSAMEAMLQGIPVVATKVSGVTDVIYKYGIGETCESSIEEIIEAIYKIADNYASYNRQESVFLLKDDLLSEQCVSIIENYIKTYTPEQIITLGEWRRDLELHGRQLVKGPLEIKKYYSQFEIAENYNADRFMQFPENCIDLLERTSISTIIKERFSDKYLKILDIAPGDGRIMQEDLKFGECLGADSSEAMLNVMKKRFAGNTNLKTMAIDFFEEDIDDKFDVITTFRYIRHFEYYQRKILYKKIKNNMKENGIFIFDVPNIKFEMPVRTQNGWHHYNIYDFFTTKEDMVYELEENGFKVVYIIAIGNNLMERIPEQCTDEPITWTFGVVKA